MRKIIPYPFHIFSSLLFLCAPLWASDKEAMSDSSESTLAPKISLVMGTESSQDTEGGTPKQKMILLPILMQEKEIQELKITGVAPKIVAKPFTSMPAIHRGFVRESAQKYTFHVMAQGATKKQCFGVARLSNALTSYEETKIFPMPKNDKRIGRTFFSNLTHSTHYKLKIAYVKGPIPITLDSWDSTLQQNGLDVDWGSIPERHITTPPDVLTNNCTFLFGSCNRFAKAGFIVSMLDKGSQMFQAMADDIHQYAHNGTPTDAVVTLGDWIYTDPLALGIAEKKTFSEIVSLYQLTNTTSGAKALIESGPPLYQVWDDHERWNDSSAEFAPKHQARADAGKKAYDLYQRPQGPQTPNNWFTTDDNLDGFVMDLRSELMPSISQAVSPQQFKALTDYLEDPIRKDRLKPVFMSTTALCFRGDGWSASPKQLRSLMKFIKTKKIEGVVFLTGDIHVGVSGLWKYNEAGTNPYVLEIASSAFHKISHSKDKLLRPSIDLSYDTKVGPSLTAIGGLSHITLEDHYTRVLFDHSNMGVQVIKKDRDNVVLEHILYNLKDGTITDVISSNPLYRHIS